MSERWHFLVPGRLALGVRVSSGRGNKKIQHFKFLLIGRGVTDRSISFEVIGRYGGEKPQFLPYGELAEASLCEEIHNRRALVLERQGGKF
jgi:hypothetical protein